MKKYFKILFTFVLMFCFSSLVKADSLGCYFSLFNVYNSQTEAYDVWYLNDAYNLRNGPTSLDDAVGSATVERSGSNCISIFNMTNTYFNNNFYGYVIGFYNNGLGSRIYYNSGDEQVFNLYITQIYYNVLKSGNFKIDVWDSATTMNKREQKVYKYSEYCNTKTNKIGAYDFAIECKFPYSFSQNSYLTFYPTYLPFSSPSNTGLAYRIDNNYENINDSINNATDKILQGQDKINDTLNSEDSDTSSKKCGVVCKLKGIWEGIVSLPKKVADAFGDILKSLFVPEDNYFKNWFDELSTYFNNKLGFLVYPFTFITDTLNRYLNLEDTGHYVISISDIKAPLFDTVIFSATSYDLADLLKNSTFSYAHNLWFAFLNFGVLVAFLNLCYRKYVSIFGGDNSGDYEYFTEEEGHEYDINSGEVTRSWIKSKKSSRKKVE